MSVKGTLTRPHIPPYLIWWRSYATKSLPVSYSDRLEDFYFFGTEVSGLSVGFFGRFMPLIRRGAILTAIRLRRRRCRRCRSADLPCMVASRYLQSNFYAILRAKDRRP